MIFKLDQMGRKTWATKVKELLFHTGFGFVWISQDVGDISECIRVAKRRLMDIAFQEWHSQMNNTSKLSTLCEFKSLLEPEKYLDYINCAKFRPALTRFRCSAHNLEIEIGRRNKVERQMRFCKFCEKRGEYLIEDEYHFLMLCSLYENLRKKHIPKSFILYPSGDNCKKATSK